MPSLSVHALTLAETRHLLNRAGFGADPADIQSFASLTREQSVDRLLAGVHTAPTTPAPPWVQDSFESNTKPADKSPEAKAVFQKKMQQQNDDLKTWWYSEMIRTPSPLTERMTLFWHNHFTSSLEKGIRPILMYRQNLLLRYYAFGNFQPFLIAIAQDPAMMNYLDTASNRKGQANENFARELMELFTLGEGHYSEDDIKEAARAFTGWSVDTRTGDFKRQPRQHDDGKKTFMGHSGFYDGDNILDLLLQNPRTAEFITEKIWKEFISPTPDPMEVKRLAAIFRDQHYEIQPLMRAVFLSPAFWDPAHRGVLTRSPVDLMVGTIRTFQVPMDDAMPLVSAGRTMGQDVMNPPNVKGWPGGDRWISTFSLMTRRQFLAHLLRGKEMEGHMNGRSVQTTAVTASRTTTIMMKDNHPLLQGIDLNEWMGHAGFHDAQDLQNVEAILLPIPPIETIPTKADLPHQIQAVVLDPTYELE